MLVRVPEALAAVGLQGQGRRFARELSGGQQQRLALAGVLAPRPGILVLDEPTANLDPDGVRAFDDRLREIRAERTATIVLVEHRAAAAWSMADIVLALGPEGRPIAVGPPREVLDSHRDSLRSAGIWLPDDAIAGPDPRFVEAPTGGEAIRADRIQFGFERAAPVIRGIDLVVAGGERIALVGPNGGGKSTLARLLVGLLRPDAGSIRLFGRDPARLAATELVDQVGYVFQQPERQFLTQRVRAEIELGLSKARLGDAEAIMDRIGLPLRTFGERSPYRLSGGEQRRLSLASALIRRPHLLVLDEPTYGQDRLGYEALLGILHENLDSGASLLVVTHDERLVADVASRIVRLDDGRLVDLEP